MTILTILSGAWLDQLTQDLRAAVRSLTRYPVAAAVAVLSLAAGIGISSATLAIRDTIFRNPPPLYRQPEQLSFVQTRDGGPPRPVPLGLYRAWTEMPATGQWAGVRPGRRDDVRASDRTETLSVQAVTPNLFLVLGVQPAIGRTFDQRSRAAIPRRWCSHTAPGNSCSTRARMRSDRRSGSPIGRTSSPASCLSDSGS